MIQAGACADRPRSDASADRPRSQQRPGQHPRHGRDGRTNDPNSRVAFPNVRTRLFKCRQSATETATRLGKATSGMVGRQDPQCAYRPATFPTAVVSKQATGEMTHATVELQPKATSDRLDDEKRPTRCATSSTMEAWPYDGRGPPVSGFMIQAGASAGHEASGPARQSATGQQRLKNARYPAMARTSTRIATAQSFINAAATLSSITGRIVASWGYAVFGRVAKVTRLSRDRKGKRQQGPRRCAARRRKSSAPTCWPRRSSSAATPSGPPCSLRRRSGGESTNQRSAPNRGTPHIRHRGRSF